MYFSLITENYYSSKVSFSCVDDREFLYSTNDVVPTSSCEPICWQDQDNGSVNDVDPIADSGDLSVSKELAEIIMSFDPYGVEVYPSKLLLKDGILEERYLIAVNNVIDIMDDERSKIEKSPYSDRNIVHVLYISEKKMKLLPLNKRIVFRVRGAETAMFFSEEIYDAIDGLSEFSSLRKIKLNCDKRMPKI